MAKGVTRREALKLSGLALGGLAVGGAMIGLGAGKIHADQTCDCPEGPTCTWTGDPSDTQQYSYFKSLDLFHPYDQSTKTTIAPLGKDEMRITFMGSCIPPVRRAQQMMSVFVEVGWDKKNERPLDQFVFDCGSGVCANYGAMNVGFGRMDKIFLAHLHGDHMSDLTHIYCFGPSADRKSPLYVFGPGPSGVPNPGPNANRLPYYDDGTKAFCQNLREALRWHTESFSFQTTSYPGYPTRTQMQRKWGLPCKPVSVSDDPWGDAFGMVPIQLDWTKYGRTPGDNVAYNNTKTGVKITHFPVIHCRKGSIGYKLEWNGLSMIYTSDTKPEIRSRDQAVNGGEGVDVLIHESVVPAQIWAMKNQHLSTPPPFDDPGVEALTTVQNSSHSPQGAFGYYLSQIKPPPRLTVVTHFPVANDTVTCAMQSVLDHNPNIEWGKDIIWSFDLMVIKVTPTQITQLQASVSDFGFSPTVNLPDGAANSPKYHYPDGSGNPFAQIDTSTAMPDCDGDKCNYRDDGY
ncbi:MAG: hypothetical protein WAW37_20075 [Syntrophobacteraceae bacterium]